MQANYPTFQRTRGALPTLLNVLLLIGGIGRELYSSPKIQLILKKKYETYINDRTKNVALSNDITFFVSEIEYDEAKRIIKALVIKDGTVTIVSPTRTPSATRYRNESKQRSKSAHQLPPASKKAKKSRCPKLSLLSERAEEAPPIIKPKNMPPPKDDDTRNMCIMCGVGISKAVAAISNRKVQQTVCLQCSRKNIERQV